MRVLYCSIYAPLLINRKEGEDQFAYVAMVELAMLQHLHQTWRSVRPPEDHCPYFALPLAVSRSHVSLGEAPYSLATAPVGLPLSELVEGIRINKDSSRPPLQLPPPFLASLFRDLFLLVEICAQR